MLQKSHTDEGIKLRDQNNGNPDFR